MQKIIAALDARREEARLGGGSKRIDTQHAKGKLTARERLDVLLAEMNDGPEAERPEVEDENTTRKRKAS